MDTMLAGQAPADILAQGPRVHLRQRELRLTIPEHRLPGTAQLPKFLEDAGDRVLHVPVRNFFEAIVPCADEPDGDFPHDMAALDFRFKGVARPLAHET